MKRLNSKKAFALIELLVVLTIMGLVSTAALVVLKDTGEVKALQYTKKIMKAIKDGIAEKEEGRVFTGFMNDFGTMPPNTHFLLNIESNATFINGELGKYRIVNLKNRSINDNNISMPFLDDKNATDYNDSKLDLNVSEFKRFKTSVMYIGHHGGYIGEGIDGDKSRAIKDGWGKAIRLENDFNISETHSNGDIFLMLNSAGTDGKFKNEPKYLKDEFDAFKEDRKNIEAVYAEDYNRTYRKEYFVPRNMNITLDFDRDDINATKVIIYSPMLYFAEDSSNKTCSENNTTHANCTGGVSGKYIPYDFRVDTSSLDNNMSWHVGVVKYEFYYDYNHTDKSLNEGTLSINNELTAYTSLNSDIDFTSEFYITAGEKQVVILDGNGTDNWHFSGSCSKIFMANEPVNINFADKKCK